ncbi:protein kinase [Cystobacter fuscus]|uniref:protein kinase domain-containing protein n=1 Tax=Cystobacter fuscus TaxID=43 RepID=UPI002B2DE1CD|nr:protein kinase [Cystobacter fuscus]
MINTGSLVLDDRFRVLKLLGTGGMGEVYLGEQVSLGRRVAIKVLHSDLMVHPSMIERFKREARMLSAVDHPAVVRVIDYGETAAGACIVMEYVEGENLYDVLQQGALPPMRALPLLHQLAEGLAAIHDRGIIHRDIKPENVLLTRGPRGEQARLLDFGIARLMEADKAGNLSQVGLVVGTPEYLSPEQAVGAPVDARSDLYSFGALAYRMLSGQLPFPGPSPTQYVAQHASASPMPLIEAAPTLSGHAPLVALVMQLLRKDPQLRLPSAHALVEALGAMSAPAVPTPFPQVLASGTPFPPLPSISRFPIPSSTPPSSGTLAFAEPVTVEQTEISPAGTSAFGGPPPPEAPAPRNARSTSQAPTRATPGRQLPEGAVSPSRAFTVPSPSPLNAAREEPEPESPEPSSSGSQLVTVVGSASGKTRNLTLMLTDLQDYTERTSRQTHEQNARMLETHDRLLLPLVRDYNGRLVQKRGDALLIVFSSPTQAVLCGMAMQDRLWRHNQQCGPDERLPVRVCLHTGEVLVTRDTVIGEPVEVVKAVEQVAEAGDVVFTGSVNLARTRVEGDCETFGDVPLPGTNEPLPLYRCRRASEGLPFGGQDEVSMRPPLKDRLDTAMRPVLAARDSVVWAAKTVVQKSGARVRSHPRRALGVGLGVFVLLGVGTFEWVRRHEPTYAARQLLAEGKANEALKLLAELPAETKKEARVLQVRARALHEVNRHTEELSTLNTLDAASRESLDEGVLDGLAADFGEDENLKSLRKFMATLSKEQVKERFEELAEEDFSPRQWGALRYLEAMQSTDGLDLVKLYIQALASKDCAVRASSARRLEGLGDAKAVAALEELSRTPRVGTKNCGQNEARNALDTLTKK